ncbi:unnamed protein product [Oikopleura dioica]|uniref:Uncharacterized protein n=1 Tax=Oikopleura dioica TaxID=34765 RepID=E4XJ02_OIKDI|nr:unnamed protein product [Oikopleura dioica]
MGKYPQPNPFDEENPEEHPHLAFQIDYKAISEAFADVPDFSGFFIHLVTKVCVTNGENCFGTCTDAEIEEAENERNNRNNMLNDGSCIMADDEPEEPGLQTTTPKNTLPVCPPNFGKEFDGWTESRSTLRISEPKGSLLDRLKGQLWTEILKINKNEEETRIKPADLLEQIKEEEQKNKARERRNADHLSYEQIRPPTNYFEKNGGSKRLSMKGGVVETFGPWPFVLPSRELRPAKQADILFYSKPGSSNFASWSNSKSGHFVLVLILLVDVALGLNALRLRRSQHARLLE